MAFGDTATLIDDFNRGDENPAADWTDLENGFGVVSNELEAEIDASCMAGYDVTTFGPDVEAYCTLRSLATANHFADAIFMRMTSLAIGTVDGYMSYHSRATSELRIYRLDDGGYTQLGSAVTWAKSVGDKLGGSVIGDNIKCYIDDSGSWTEKMSRSDSAHDAAGYLGYRAQYLGAVPILIDDYYGGTIEAAPVSQVFFPIRR